MSEVIFRLPDFGRKQKMQYCTESSDFASCTLWVLNLVSYIKGRTYVERVREWNDEERV